MYYPGPDRYQQSYERRPAPRGYMEPHPPYGYAPQHAPPPPPPPPPMFRNYYGPPPPEPYRMRVAPPIDQGEELLDRLEQTGRVPSKDKFRRMACMTFISTGVCPYSDRCVFMHDFRIKAENARVKTTRQSKADNTIKDTFYWPDMTRRDICRYLDAQGLPDANQRYVIPESFASTMSSFHNRGLYSIWNHFVEFCAHNSRLQEEHRRIERDSFFQISSYLGNRHVFGTYRLKIFVHLSMVVETSPVMGKLDLSFASGNTSFSGGSGASTPPRPPDAPFFAFASPPLSSAQSPSSLFTSSLSSQLQFGISPRAVMQQHQASRSCPAERDLNSFLSPPRSKSASSTGVFPTSVKKLPLFPPSPAVSPVRPVRLEDNRFQGAQEREEEDWILNALSVTSPQQGVSAIQVERDVLETDLVVIANTQANHILACAAAEKEHHNILSPTKHLRGKSVVWADALKAKLERWEGDSASTLSDDSHLQTTGDCWEGEGARDITVSDSCYGGAEEGGPDISTDSSVWDRLPELQRPASNDILRQAGFETRKEQSRSGPDQSMGSELSVSGPLTPGGIFWDAHPSFCSIERTESEADDSAQLFDVLFSFSTDTSLLEAPDADCTTTLAAQLSLL